jgi:hypothetical protein
MDNFRPEKIFQCGKQSRRCFFDGRLAGQGHHPREIRSRTSKARFNHEALDAIGETDQRPLIGYRDFGRIGDGRHHHAVGQDCRRQKQK